MKNTWVILSCAGLLVACSRPAIPGTAAAHVPDGYYYGTDGLFTTVFVKLARDIASMRRRISPSPGKIMKIISGKMKTMQQQGQGMRNWKVNTISASSALH